MQINSGSVGICCQKIGEAEVMAAAGITNIIIPYNIVGASKVDRLLRLARRINLTVAVDSETTARGISEGSARHGGEVKTLIELDTGSKRCGVQSPAEAQALARKIADLPGIDFQGVMTYPSRTTIGDYLAETVERITNDSIPVNVVSGGGTGAEQISKEIGCTDTRAGSYVWEWMTRIKGREDLSDERCPLRILTTVVSRPTSDRLIIDGGLKTFCSYPPVPYGYCVEHPELKIMGMSIEHGNVDTSESSHNFQVGERLTWIPLHQEMALNLHDELVGYRGEQIEVVWPVLGRGKVK
jgi:D-serine deaminase-like pyridoxal phosphate-dependent protein